MFDAAYPHGRHYYWKAHKLGPLTNEVIDVVIDHAARVTSLLSAIPIFCFGGAVARVPEHSTTSPYRAAAHDLNIVASWPPEDVELADRHIDWVRGMFQALEPYSRGVYVNFTSDDADERVRQAYTAQQLTRLTALKAKFDPTNLFRLNAEDVPPENTQCAGPRRLDCGRRDLVCPVVRRLARGAPLGDPAPSVGIRISRG